MLNWIIWNRTIFIDLALNNLERLTCHKTPTTNQPTRNIRSIIIIIIIIIPWMFFTSVLADGFLLELEWQQDSSSLQDSSQNFDRSQ